MKILTVVIAAVCLTACKGTTPSTSSISPQDFSQGLSIDVPAGEAFFRIDLPARVFFETAWPDLRDLAVFNAAGEPVSFARVAPPSAEATTERVALRTFRLDTVAPGAPAQIQLDAQGIELRVTPDTGPQRGVEYLLALGDRDLGTPITRLFLDWQDDASNWRQTVTVDVSPDLDRWDTIALSRPIMDLRTDDGQRLKHGVVIVDRTEPQTARYWRLRFGRGIAPRLTSVEGETTSAVPPPPGVLLPTRTYIEADSTVYDFAAPQPVARLRLTPRAPNSVLPLAIEGRESDVATWQPLARTAAYRIVMDGVEQHSEPVTLAGRRLKSIRLRPMGTSWGTQPPLLVAERDPLTLVVNARGAGPFLLAWGNRAAEDPSVSFATLVPNASSRRALDIVEGRAGSLQRLGGQSRLTETSPAERAAVWHTSLVWVLLIGGAGALAWLAFRVWRESQRRGAV